MNQPTHTARETPVRVAVFAHNEQRSIANALDQLLREGEAIKDYTIHVLVNGSTDQTLGIAQGYAAQHPGRVKPHRFGRGDKAATWNRYLYDVSVDAPATSVHVFTDADVWPEPGSVARMADALDKDARIAAVGGLPMSGRNRAYYHRLAKEKHLIYGNLYATRDGWLRWAREIGFRLPAGLVFEDAVLTNAFTTLPEDLRRSRLTRVAHLEGCGYRFTPIRPWRHSEALLYARRLVRYRLADYQLKRLGWRWPDELPETMDTINSQVLEEIKSRGVKVRPIDFFLARRLKAQYTSRAA
ncbi:MAG: glycosyltransferase family A protein [Phycisphaeraceae bacterium]